MKKVYNLSDTRVAEKALELLFSVPLDTEASDVEAGEGAVEELV